MAVDAAVNAYREEYIPIFRRGNSLLRNSCVKEISVSGKNAIFLVAGTSTTTASERGNDGLIVARQNSNTQNTVTLKDLSDLVEGTKFNWDLSQGNQRMIAAEDSADVIHRKIDDQIITQLDTATVNTGASATASLAMVQDAIATLGEADVKVEEEDNMFALFSMRARGYLMQIPEFASADYVDYKKLDGSIMRYYRWAGVNWIFHNALTGKGTATEQCFIYHRNAIGSACDTEQMDAQAGLDLKQNLYWARSTAWAEAGKLQDSGIVMVNHNGS